MREPNVKWIPIVWKKEYIGFCADDMNDAGKDIKEGRWIEIKHEGNAISAKTIEVQENNNWRDHLIWIPRKQLPKLGLPPDVNKNEPSKDPQDPKGEKLVKVNLGFKRLRLPRDKVFWFTVAMAVVALITLILKALYDGEMLTEPFLSVVGVVVLILLAFSTVVNAFSAYLQQK